MDGLAGLTTGGDEGAALLPGNPQKSLFLQNILSTDPDTKGPTRYSAKVQKWKGAQVKKRGV